MEFTMREANPAVPRIENPTHAGENFADTWDQAKYERFKSYIRNFRAELKALLNPSMTEQRMGLEKSTERLGHLFGSDRVKDAIRIEASEMNERRNNGKLGIGSGGVLTALSQVGAVAVPRNQFFGR